MNLHYDSAVVEIRSSSVKISYCVHKMVELRHQVKIKDVENRVLESFSIFISARPYAVEFICDVSQVAVAHWCIQIFPIMP